MRSIAQSNTKGRFFVVATIIFLIGSVALNLLRPPELVYEWNDIVPTLIDSHEYKYLGKYSAFMPPLYPVYLYVVHEITGGNHWLVVSTILQASLFCGSVLLFIREIFDNWLNSTNALYAYLLSIFFPSIFYGVNRISAFALSVSLFLLVVCYAYRMIRLGGKMNVFLYLIVSLLAFYVRWDFPIYFIGLTFIVLRVLKKPAFYLAIIPLVIIIIYAPWCIRNYYQVGSFSYTTNSAFNLAKGNHIKFDLLKINNSPYDESTGKEMPISTLSETFTTELERDAYLRKLFSDYIKNHPDHFVTNSLGKLAVNLTQFFPESFSGNYINSGKILSIVFTIMYSCFFIAFLVLLIKEIIKKGKAEIFIFKLDNILFQFVVICFVLHFAVNTFLAPPLPRYILFYFPLFIAFILQQRAEVQEKSGGRVLIHS